MYPITGQCQAWTNNNPWAVDQSRVDIVQKTRDWTRGIEIWLRNTSYHILYHITTWVSMCGCNSDSESVQFLLFLLIGFAHPGGLYFIPQKSANPTQKRIELFFFPQGNALSKNLAFQQPQFYRTFFTPENVGFPMCFYGKVSLRQDTTRCVSAGEALRSPRPTPPRPQSATAAATGRALPSGYLT